MLLVLLASLVVRTVYGRSNNTNVVCANSKLSYGLLWFLHIRVETIDIWNKNIGKKLKKNKEKLQKKVVMLSNKDDEIKE